MAVAPLQKEVIKGVVAELTKTILAVQKENSEKIAELMALSAKLAPVTPVVPNSPVTPVAAAAPPIAAAVA